MMGYNDAMMITLRRLNGQEVLVNADLIETVERHGDQRRGDTVVSLTTGNRMVVQDLPDAIRGKVLEYRSQVQAEADRRRETGAGARPAPPR